MTPTRIVAALLYVVVLGVASAFPATAAEGVVNINSAGASELMLLPRIGPSVAEKIIEHREKNGDFKTTEDLMLVRGIGEATYALLKPYVSLSGATTLTEKVKPPKKSTADD